MFVAGAATTCSPAPATWRPPPSGSPTPPTSSCAARHFIQMEQPERGAPAAARLPRAGRLMRRRLVAACCAWHRRSLTACDQGGNESTIEISGTTPTGLRRDRPPSPTAPTATDVPDLLGHRRRRPADGRRHHRDRAGGAVGPGLPAGRRRDRHRARHPPGAADHAGGRRRHRARRPIDDGQRRRARPGCSASRVSPDFANDRTAVLLRQHGRRQPRRPCRARRRPARRAGADPDRHPERLHPRRRPAGVRPRRLPLRLHRRDRHARRSPRTASSLAGKILRITPDGDPAPATRFDSPVWSWGHRNVQGLAFDDDGSLWASRVRAGHVRRAQPDPKRGDNYGWPEVEGRAASPSYVDPRVTWSTDEASPSGLAYADGLPLDRRRCSGERLWRVDVDGGEASDPTGRSSSATTAGCAPSTSPPTAGLWLMTTQPRRPRRPGRERRPDPGRRALTQSSSEASERRRDPDGG